MELVENSILRTLSNIQEFQNHQFHQFFEFNQFLANAQTNPNTIYNMYNDNSMHLDHTQEVIINNGTIINNDPSLINNTLNRVCDTLNNMMNNIINNQNIHQVTYNASEERIDYQKEAHYLAQVDSIIDLEDLIDRWKTLEYSDINENDDMYDFLTLQS